MKITRKWLELHSPCADGGSWGELEVGPEGLDLEECWAKFKRADWLVWMLWATDSVDLGLIRLSVLEITSPRLALDSPKAVLADLSAGRAPAEIYMRAMGEAHAANLLGKEQEARELMSVGYLARSFDAARSEGQVIHALQAALVQLALSYELRVPDRIHRALCDEIRREYLAVKEVV